MRTGVVVRPGYRLEKGRLMGLLILFGAEESLFMWLSLFGALLLTLWEVHELGLERKIALWWLLLVVLTHVIGYIALRVWVVATGRRATRWSR